MPFEMLMPVSFNRSPIRLFVARRWLRPRMIPCRVAFSLAMSSCNCASSSAGNESSPSIIVAILPGSQAMAKTMFSRVSFWGSSVPMKNCQVIESSGCTSPGFRAAPRLNSSA